MKKVLLFLLMLFSVLSYSQKFKFKNQEVLVDGSTWLKYDGCGGFDSFCSLVNTTNGDEIIFIKVIRVSGVEARIPSNPDGDLVYWEVSFLGLNKKIELKKSSKSIVELLYKSKVINEDQTLNEEKVNLLVEKYGTEFSDRLNKSNNGQTIIINNNQEPKKSGININIGG